MAEHATSMGGPPPSSGARRPAPHPTERGVDPRAEYMIRKYGLRYGAPLTRNPMALTLTVPRNTESTVSVYLSVLCDVRLLNGCTDLL